MSDELYVIGGVRYGERSVAFEVISPSGEVRRLRMTKKMWESYGFSSADTVSKRIFAEMKRDSEICEATSRAVSLLSDSSHSCNALCLKLRQKGFSKEASESAVAAVLRAGYIDEKGQACDIALKMAKSKLRGPARITSELQVKGYPRDIARDAALSVSEDVYDEALRKAVSQKLRNGVPQDKKEMDKLVSSLVRTGFASGKIAAVVRELSREG